MKNTLYQEFSNLYTAMSNDRYFGNQLDFLLNTFTKDHPCRNLLELFAGQSQHSLRLFCYSSHQGLHQLYNRNKNLRPIFRRQDLWYRRHTVYCRFTGIQK